MAYDTTGNAISGPTFVHEVDGELDFARAVVYFETTSNPYASNIVFQPQDPEIVPQPGDAWSENHKSLLLHERIYSVVGQVPNPSGPGVLFKVKCECIYRKFRTPEASNNTYSERGSSSLSQFETVRDVNNTKISVADPADPNDPAKRVSPMTIVQEPRIVTQRQLQVDLVNESPEEYAQTWINRVNMKMWRGGDARQWLCTHVDWEMLKPPNRFNFTLEFEKTQRNEGWVYDMFFTENNKVPAGATYPTSGIGDGVGIHTFEWHFLKDFGKLLP